MFPKLIKSLWKEKNILKIFLNIYINGFNIQKKQNKNKSLHKFLEKMAKKPLNPLFILWQ